MSFFIAYITTATYKPYSSAYTKNALIGSKALKVNAIAAVLIKYIIVIAINRPSGYKLIFIDYT